VVNAARGGLPSTADRVADGSRLHEAPVLAAHGYVLSGGEADGDSAEAWSAGAVRLRGRDPLPGDRASFFSLFRPAELLGLALGTGVNLLASDYLAPDDLSRENSSCAFLLGRAPS
jgi:hypothetical protein